MKKKIAIISGCYYGQVRGGAELQLFLLSNYLKNLDYKISYLFIDNGSPIEYEEEFELIKIKKKHRLRRLINQYFFLDSFQVYKKLAAIKPDIIIIRGGFAYVGIAAKYCAKHDCTMIWQIASKKDLEPVKPSFRRTIFFDYIDKKFLEYGIKNADIIIGQAEYQSDLLYKNYKRRCDLIVSNFHPLPEEKIEKQDPIKIVWVANFKELKRPELFIKLASEFKEHQGVNFVMIGRNSSDGHLKDIGAKIIQAKNIDYRGELPLTGVNAILSDSHILVNTSRVEGFSNTFIQAWMRKVPVVSLNVDPDDIIKKNKIGFHSGNFQQMVKDIQSLISDSKLREDMGERAQKYALQNFSLDNMNKIVELIEG